MSRPSGVAATRWTETQATRSLRPTSAIHERSRTVLPLPARAVGALLQSPGLSSPSLLSGPVWLTHAVQLSTSGLRYVIGDTLAELRQLVQETNDTRSGAARKPLRGRQRRPW